MAEGERGIEPHPAPAGAEPHKRQPPPDGQLFAGPSRVGEHDSIYLVLHRGWTMYIGRDPVDEDWCAMVKPGVHLTIQEFLDADPANGKLLDRFVPTRSAVLAWARSAIDETLADESK